MCLLSPSRHNKEGAHLPEGQRQPLLPWHRVRWIDDHDAAKTDPSATAPHTAGTDRNLARAAASATASTGVPPPPADASYGRCDVVRSD